MDEIDLQIINELKENARKPFKQIAETIGVSISTVSKRYNEMKENGIIQLCSIKIDLRKIGYAGIAYILITASHKYNLSESMDQVKSIPNIIIASKAIGDYEGYAILAFKNIKDFYEKMLQIRNLPGISSVEVSFTVDSMQNFPPDAIPCKPLKLKLEPK